MAARTGLQQVEENKTQNWSKRVCWGLSGEKLEDRTPLPMKTVVTWDVEAQPRHQ
jgi:hypothetical protein